MACADADLECLAAAAQQLQQLERLDLEAVQVGICIQWPVPSQR